MMIAATLIFSYYSFWLFVTPFLNKNDVVLNYFLPIDVNKYNLRLQYMDL